MQIKFRTLLLALPLLMLACSEGSDSEVQPRPKMVNVTIGSGPRFDIETQAGTRTSIGDDGETIRWTGDDAISLWAVHAETGVAAFEALPFAMFHYNSTYNSAKFTADIPEMTAGTYRYYAVSPTPAATSGTLATFEIPQTQTFRLEDISGERTTLPHDIMVATAVEAPELVEGDNSETVNLTFSHKVHLLKVVVQANRLNEKVSEIELSFPRPVVGRITVDAADPTAEPTLENGHSTLRLLFDTPVEAGTTVYAAILPSDFTDETITIKSYGETGESLIRSIVPSRAFAAGHTTPLIYTIPTLGRLYTRLVFEQTANNLGEPVQQITLTSKSGGLFDNGSTTRTFTPDANGKYTIFMRPSWTDNLSNTTVSATYESEHAIVSGEFSIPQITAYESNTASFIVPYLFEENFSKATLMNNNGGLSNNGHQGDTVWGDDCGLPGWSGNQFYVEPGKALAIRHQTEKVALLGTYRGRVDSAPIATCLKSNVSSIKVRVLFNYNGKTNNSKHTPILNYGYTTSQEALSGYYEGGSATVKGGTKIENQVASINSPTTGSFDNISERANFVIESCTKQHRLSWDCFVETGSRNWGTSQQWVFIDNICVSIEQ